MHQRILLSFKPLCLELPWGSPSVNTSLARTWSIVAAPTEDSLNPICTLHAAKTLLMLMIHQRRAHRKCHHASSHIKATGQQDNAKRQWESASWPLLRGFSQVCDRH